MSAVRTPLRRMAMTPRIQAPSTAASQRQLHVHQAPRPPPKPERIGGAPFLLGALCIILPGGLYLLSRGTPDNIAHNDHDAQKRLHTRLTEVERSRYPAGRIGGRLVGIDEVVTTRHEDVVTDLPVDALNHPVNREKIEKTMQLKPPSKRVDPIKSVRGQ